MVKFDPIGMESERIQTNQVTIFSDKFSYIIFSITYEIRTTLLLKVVRLEVSVQNNYPISYGVLTENINLKRVCNGQFARWVRF